MYSSRCDYYTKLLIGIRILWVLHKKYPDDIVAHHSGFYCAAFRHIPCHCLSACGRGRTQPAETATVRDSRTQQRDTRGTIARVRAALCVSGSPPAAPTTSRVLRHARSSRALRSCHWLSRRARALYSHTRRTHTGWRVRYEHNLYSTLYRLRISAKYVFLCLCVLLNTWFLDI